MSPELLGGDVPVGQDGVDEHTCTLAALQALYLSDLICHNRSGPLGYALPRRMPVATCATVSGRPTKSPRALDGSRAGHRIRLDIPGGVQVPVALESAAVAAIGPFRQRQGGLHGPARAAGLAAGKPRIHLHKLRAMPRGTCIRHPHKLEPCRHPQATAPAACSSPCRSRSASRPSPRPMSWLSHRWPCGDDRGAGDARGHVDGLRSSYRRVPPLGRSIPAMHFDRPRNGPVQPSQFGPGPRSMPSDSQWDRRPTVWPTRSGPCRYRRSRLRAWAVPIRRYRPWKAACQRPPYRLIVTTVMSPSKRSDSRIRTVPILGRCTRRPSGRMVLRPLDAV